MKQGITPDIIAQIKAINEAKTDEEFLACMERLLGLPAAKDDKQRFSACTFHFAPEKQ